MLDAVHPRPNGPLDAIDAVTMRRHWKPVPMSLVDHDSQVIEREL